MANLLLVINTCISFLNTRLHYFPFSFTILHFYLAMFVGGIIVGFIRRLFDME